MSGAYIISNASGRKASKVVDGVLIIKTFPVKAKDEEIEKFFAEKRSSETKATAAAAKKAADAKAKAAKKDDDAKAKADAKAKKGSPAKAKADAAAKVAEKVAAETEAKTK